MKVIDCYWEFNNLGKKTAEIQIDKGDEFDGNVVKQVNQTYQYVVVKVPMNMPTMNFSLTAMGFTLIETQINISKRYKDFNFDDRLVRTVYNHVNTKSIESKGELDEIIAQITPDMFSTDRIYLDPNFTREMSSKRYINWLRSDYEQGKAYIVKTYYDDINVGFGFDHIEDGVKHGVLGGIYEKYQDMGLGIMTAALPFIMAKKRNSPLTVFKTAVSSNNPSVWQFYNYLGFKIDKMTYVFVKHNDL